MPAYFRAGSFNTDRYGWSWHGEEANFESLTDTDDVSSSLVKARIHNVYCDKVQSTINIPITDGDGQPLIENDKQVFITKPLPKEPLYLTGVPWTDDGIQVLGRSVKRYVPVQNQQYANILNPLVDSGYKVAGVMMVGIRGEIFGVQLELPEFTVNTPMGDELHRCYLYVYTNRETGQQGFDLTVVRVVCANTHSLAVSNMPTIPSTGKPELILDYRTNLVARLTRESKAQKASLERLVAKPFTLTQLSTLAESLYPLPGRGGVLVDYDAMPESADLEIESNFYVHSKGVRADKLWQNKVDRQIAHQTQLLIELDKFNEKNPKLANTAYAGWQAITAHTSHHEGESKTYHLFFGDRAKINSRAWIAINKS